MGRLVPLPALLHLNGAGIGSFRKTESSWWAPYRHPTREIRAEVAYDGILEVNFSWQGEKWMAISPGQTFTDIHLCIYPKSLDEAMKERLEQRYNLAYSIVNAEREKKEAILHLAAS